MSDQQFRHEEKFLVSSDMMEVTRRRLANVMDIDTHASHNNQYHIRSVYFDDMYHSCYYDNENGIDPRSKFRIRIYNLSSDVISLEKKSKIRGMTLKQTYQIDYDDCLKMIKGETIDNRVGQSPVLDEWIYLRNARLLKPVFICEYLRIPYVFKQGNVRITFDTKICASKQCSNLFSPNISRIAVMKSCLNLIEIKYDSYLPDVLRGIIDNTHMNRISFSKFYLSYKAIGGHTIVF